MLGRRSSASLGRSNAGSSTTRLIPHVPSSWASGEFPPGVGRLSVRHAFPKLLVSLAGVPPLAGFFGKFLLLKAVLSQGSSQPAYYWLAGVAIVGVVISLYYYFGIIRAIYWSKNPTDLSPILISLPMKVSLYTCMAGMFYLGVFPNLAVNLASEAVRVLRI